ARPGGRPPTRVLAESGEPRTPDSPWPSEGPDRPERQQARIPSTSTDALVLGTDAEPGDLELHSPAVGEARVGVVAVEQARKRGVAADFPRGLHGLRGTLGDGLQPGHADFAEDIDERHGQIAHGKQAGAACPGVRAHGIQSTAGMTEVDVLELGPQRSDGSDAEHCLPAQVVGIQVEEIPGGAAVDSDVRTADRTAEIQAERSHRLISKGCGPYARCEHCGGNDSESFAVHDIYSDGSAVRK